MECNSSNFELDLTNFQSISKAHLEFVKGINIIVGQSNSGKSATLRAIKANILNTTGANRFIRNGSEDSTVSIKYRGNDINWYRNKKESKYTVNGEDYIKVGSSNLFKILEDNGFVVDDKNNLMNVESELELPFPFDRNSSELFKLFENIFCVSDSACILKLMKDDEDRNDKERKRKEEEILKLDNKLKALEELEQEVDLDKLKRGKELLVSLCTKKETLEDTVSKITKITYLIKQLDLREPKIDFTNDTITKYDTLRKNCTKINTTVELIKLGKSILSDKDITTDNKLDSVERLEKLHTTYFRLKNTELLLTLSESCTKELSVDNSAIDNYLTLKNVFLKVMNIKKEAKELKDKLELEEKALEEIQEKLSSYKVCPLCGSDIGDNNE